MKYDDRQHAVQSAHGTDMPVSVFIAVTSWSTQLEKDSVCFIEAGDSVMDLIFHKDSRRATGNALLRTLLDFESISRRIENKYDLTFRTGDNVYFVSRFFCALNEFRAIFHPQADVLKAVG